MTGSDLATIPGTESIVNLPAAPSKRLTLKWLRSDTTGAYTVRRLLLVIPILFGVSLTVFVLLHLTPGSPADSLVGPYATADQRAEASASLGLDRPLVVQFSIWLGRLLHGDLGRSISAQAPVRPIVLEAFGNTMLLAVFAGLFATVVGLPLGVVMARSRSRVLRLVSRGLSVLALSTPQYAVALVLIAVVALHVHWFPTTGMYSTGQTGSLADLLRHVILPGITAGLVTLGIFARITRSALLDVADQPWVKNLHARGLSRRRVLVHTIHNMIPTLLTVAGIQFGYLIGGALFVEIIFSWPGMGQTIYNAISARDYPLIQGCVLIGAAVFVIVNVVVDIANSLIDPRTRAAAAREGS